MGCGASKKVEAPPDAAVVSAAASAPEAAKAPASDGDKGAPSTVKKEDEAVRKEEEATTACVATAARDGVLDGVGALLTEGLAPLAMIGHAVGYAALTVADCATLGMIDSIGEERDDQFEEMVDARDDAAAAFNCHGRADWYRSETPADMSDWMSKIADDTPITKMWIPGSHDTMATACGDLAECQGWNLKQQLQAGLRVLDIRIKHDGDSLKCYHGIISLGTDFNGAVTDIEEFLTAHPKEALFARVKREGACGEHACEFHDQVSKLLTKREMWNFHQQVWTRLADFRGKITMLAFGSQLRLYKQPLDVQDEYSTGDEDKKFDFIMKHSEKQREPTTLSVSFCSAVGSDGWKCFKSPGAVAYGVNKLVWDAKDKLTPGVYLFDFSANAVIKDFIAKNDLPPAAS